MKNFPYIKTDAVIALGIFFVLLLLNMSFVSIILGGLFLYFGYVFSYRIFITKNHTTNNSLISLLRVIALYFIPLLFYQVYLNFSYVSDFNTFLNPPFIPLYVLAITNYVLTYYALTLMTHKEFKNKLFLRLPLILGLIALVLPFMFIIR